MRLASLIVIIVVFVSCNKEGTEPLYNFEAPAYFPAKHYNVAFDKKKFELGRKLFYDPILSADNTVSCGDCHQQFAGFAQLDHKLSHGVNNKLGTRNSPALSNLAWATSFMWDGGINHIEVMPSAPISNPVEMNLPLAAAVGKLNQSAQYKALFANAFGVSVITDYELFKSLAMFMSYMISANSKYDQYMQGDAKALTAGEMDGMAIFMDKCAGCHKPPLFTDFSFRNNGLDTDFSKDMGRGRITQNATDMGKFKVSSLRNVALSKPYMHNGKIATLAGVLDHYSNDIKQSSTLDPMLQNNIPLTAVEKDKLLQFLNSLTDVEYTTNKTFAAHQ